jgi:signal transduction histidine kinase
MVAIAQESPIPEETREILIRFARVFEQTYIRFLDLQRAEFQALDAKRRASLDRIRGEIASMRTADDLQTITPLIWRELTTLGVPFFRCGLFIMDDENETIHSFLTTPTGEHLAELRLPYNHGDTTTAIVDHWRCCKVYFERWDREQFVAWAMSLIDHGLLEDRLQYQGADEPPACLSLHFIPFTQGVLYIGGEDTLSEDTVDLVQSLAHAFSVAYARYADFQKLEAKNSELAQALDDLQATQAQLIQAEKMASLGQLTAGIAHEIKNPLNFVNNFATLSVELASELEGALTKGEDVSAILEDLKMNAAQITKHGQRADRIVYGMMQHANGGTGNRQKIQVNTFVEEYVNLAFHGMRARNAHFNVTIEREYADDAGQIEIMPQEIGRVLINLFNNAFDALQEKTTVDADFTPTLHVRTSRSADHIVLQVSDNGPGIASDILDRIFEPFFTTKPAGRGTGLGLSLSYDIIVHGHGGHVDVTCNDSGGVTFTVQLPA